eukprot:COSAG01_NODE_49309_length_373_cov_0.912409_1_plen_99_part_01
MREQLAQLQAELGASLAESAAALRGELGEGHAAQEAGRAELAGRLVRATRGGNDRGRAVVAPPSGRLAGSLCGKSSGSLSPSLSLSLSHHSSLSLSLSL